MVDPSFDLVPRKLLVVLHVFACLLLPLLPMRQDPEPWTKAKRRGRAPLALGLLLLVASR